MASMINLNSLGLRELSTILGSRFGSSSATTKQAAQLPRVEPIAVETSSNRLTRTLKHLIKANHSNHAILYSHDRFHNHLPHALGAAFRFSPDHCTSQHLNAIYDDEKKDLEPWRDSPSEIARHDWRTQLGKTEYQRAYVDFFEDELARTGYDWKQLVLDYLLNEEGGPPLINGVLGGLAHPAIHLGYAFELGSRDVAIEGLGLTTCCWPWWHTYFDKEYQVPGGLARTGNVLTLISELREDPRFDEKLRRSGEDNIPELAKTNEADILEYWHRLDILEPAKQLKDFIEMAILLLVTTHRKGRPAFDFFLCHLLTGLWAARVLISELPARVHLSLLRQYWMLVIRIYTAQRRPQVHREYISSYNLSGKDWRWVEHQVLGQPGPVDPHYAKALRVMRDSQELFGSDDGFYLKAACKLGSEFRDWAGFGRDEHEDNNLEIKS